ncbi:DUF3892 domain-containing protein [Bradyrhizobium sp. 26S5]|uniref:DUF3892 domain-containing protein n=1 Tax=Bradyrhizobium sp. 26S5 TaxID=3139729 RepID=UPI0030CAFC2F
MTRRITCITGLPNHQDRHRRIQAVGGSGWQDSEETAIANVKRDKSAYEVTEQGKTVKVIVEEQDGREYLKTENDRFLPDIIKGTDPMATEAEIERLRLVNDLGRYGLKGTLYGTWAALTAVVIIALAQMITGKTVVDGWAFTALVFIIVLPISAFGAFVFNRAFSMEATLSGISSFKTKTAGDA